MVYEGISLTIYISHNFFSNVNWRVMASVAISVKLTLKPYNFVAIIAARIQRNQLW